MKKNILLLLILWLPVMVYSQTDSTAYQIETRDGNEFIGTIVYQDQEKIILNTKQLGEITIKKIDVKSMTQIKEDKIIAGKYWFENPQASRYFWQPNGYGLRKGEGYYQNIWVLFNQVSAGVTDHLSVGVGMVPLFMFGGAPTPVWVTPKFSIIIKKDKVNFGIGILAGSILGVKEYTYDFSTGQGHDTKTNKNFGIAYSVLTLGSRDKNISMGLGYGYAQGKWASSPSVSLGFLFRVSNKGYILSENYILNNLGIITFGGRSIIKKVSLDYGLLIPAGNGIDRLIAIPWLALVVPFNKGVPKNSNL